MANDRNLTWHDGTVTREDRQKLLGHRGATLWFTGLSGSGKSTLARSVESALHAKGALSYVLDGDNVRHGLNRDLGFGDAHRTENIRRVAEVAKLFTDAGVLVLTAFISPFRADRAQARSVIGTHDFLEVYVAASLEVCESRDPKGLYRKAREGAIPEFTGITSHYEAPESAELVVDTGAMSLAESTARVIGLLQHRGVITG